MMTRDRFDLNQEAGSWCARFAAAERKRKKRARLIDCASALVIALVLAMLAVVLISGAGQ